MASKPILIVEDNAELRSGLQKFFEGEGYSVFLANHGQVALDLFEKISTPKFGLILVDFRMPVMNGATFLLEFERIHPQLFADTAIFIMSAGTDINQSTLKATGFLEKPFDLDELVRIAAQYCKSMV